MVVQFQTLGPASLPWPATLKGSVGQQWIGYVAWKAKTEPPAWAY